MAVKLSNFLEFGGVHCLLVQQELKRDQRLQVDGPLGVLGLEVFVVCFDLGDEAIDLSVRVHLFIPRFDLLILLDSQIVATKVIIKGRFAPVYYNHVVL